MKAGTSATGPCRTLTAPGRKTQMAAGSPGAAWTATNTRSSSGTKSEVRAAVTVGTFAKRSCLREHAACLFAMLNLRRRSLFNRGRVSRGLITAEGLKQHSVEPKLAWLAKAVNPDRHALMPGRRLRAIGAEKPIPPRQVKAVIAVGFSARD